tara:strand:- start:1224 stop:1334 length:111 start_codon:yes stop_codon:yes gene_type:complete
MKIIITFMILITIAGILKEKGTGNIRSYREYAFLKN